MKKFILSQEYIRQKYCQEKLKPSQIAKQANVAMATVYLALKRHNIPIDRERIRKYAYNHSFFKTWSADMAYILGFITCDGSIKETYKNLYSLTIELQAIDVSVLEFIRGKLGPNVPIRHRERIDKRSHHKSKMVTVAFFSREMIQPLLDMGIIPNKTGKEIVPNIPEEFKWDYLRGIIDGDGWIGNQVIKKKNSINISSRIGIASASLKFLNSLKLKCFNGVGKIRMKNRNAKNTRLHCYELNIYSRKHILQILSKCYDRGFCLKRKRDKYIELLEYDKLMSSNKISNSFYERGV